MSYVLSYYTFLSFISSSLPPHYNLLMSIILISFRFSSSCCDVASKEIVIFAEAVNTITSPTVPVSLHWRWHFNIFITHRPHMLKVGIKTTPLSLLSPLLLPHSFTHTCSLSLFSLSLSLFLSFFEIKLYIEHLAVCVYVCTLFCSVMVFEDILMHTL